MYSNITSQKPKDSATMSAHRPVICRVCMAPTAPESSFNMFACKVSDDAAAAASCLAELVALVVGIEIRPDEPGDLPVWCCYRCQLDVATAYRVRTLCRESDRKLREALKKVQSDEEVAVCKVEVEEPVVESTGCEEDEPEDTEPLDIKDPLIESTYAMEAIEEPETDMISEIYDGTWKGSTIEPPTYEEFDEAEIDCDEDDDAEPNTRESEIFEEIPVEEHRSCCTCRTIFSNLEELLEHAEREHAVDNPPEDSKDMKLCRICYKLISKNHYRKHTRTTIPNTMFRCKTCATLFLTTCTAYGHYLRDHYTTKKCCGANCNAVFDTVEALQQHSEQVHLPKKRPTDPKRPAVCTICFKTYKVYSHLYAHRTRLERFKCAKCHKHFFGQRDLQRHELTHQENRCKICSKVYRDYGEYQRHKFVHRDPIFHCEPCGKQYKNRRDLIQHNIKVHGARGPHGCDLCSETFARRDYVQVHKRLRHGVKSTKAKRQQK